MLKFLAKYRETGLLLIRASLGVIFLMLITPVLWSGEDAWEKFGSAMRHLEISGYFKLWGFVGALFGCAWGVLRILGLFFRVGVLLTLLVTLVHVIALWSGRSDFYGRLPALEMAILLLGLLFVGPGKYSVDKG